MTSWYLKASLTAEFDIQVQISLSISSVEMSSILYLIPLNPSLEPLQFLPVLVHETYLLSHEREHILHYLLVFSDIP